MKQSRSESVIKVTWYIASEIEEKESFWKPTALSIKNTAVIYDRNQFFENKNKNETKQLVNAHLARCRLIYSAYRTIFSSFLPVKLTTN